MSAWNPFPKENPICSGDYLCWCETPSESGLSRTRPCIIYWSLINGGWKCTGMIVRYWMLLPEPPGGGDAD
jgi:hypothetical protein